jgi:hypothetical protein
LIVLDLILTFKTMKAYVQQQNGQWLNENCYASWYGLTRMGYEVHPFTMDNIPKDITKETPVHGGIKTIRMVLDSLGVEQPPIHNPQDYLPQYCNRNFEETTIGKINKEEREYPYFIKPMEDHKLFTGFVVKNHMDKGRLYGLPTETKILVSEYINMVSEYRCFVNRGKLVGSKNYTGDFTKNIDYNIVNKAIEDYKDQPISCSLDFALTDKGETILIEINDGFALGSYGLNPIIYSKMIVDRWKEIIDG